MTRRKYISEQLKPDLSVVEDFEQTLTKKEQIDLFTEILGEKHIIYKSIESKQVNALEYHNNGKNQLIVFKTISYLGHPHPLHKKRIQMSMQHEIALNQLHHTYDDIRIIGVYHYEGLVLFVDFDVANTYRKFNNTSLHVNINDLYLGLRNKCFKKVDKNGNGLSVVPSKYFKQYLDDELSVEENELFALFKRFNQEMQFDEWITIMEALPFMYENGGQWKQGEWPGFFLENKFSLFITENQLEKVAKFTAREHKKEDWANGIFDFDVFFPQHHFYGDLKASDITKKVAPGNDKESFLECLNQYEKFWYIIYEHETKLDKQEHPEDFVGTRYRTDFIAEKDGTDNQKPLSYKERLKYSVCFKSMKILELNRVNFRKALIEFNQGKQPSGAARKPKFNIYKNIEDDDNIVIYRYQKNVFN